MSELVGLVLIGAAVIAYVVHRLLHRVLLRPATEQYLDARGQCSVPDLSNLRASVTAYRATREERDSAMLEHMYSTSPWTDDDWADLELRRLSRQRADLVSQLRTAEDTYNSKRRVLIKSGIITAGLLIAGALTASGLLTQFTVPGLWMAMALSGAGLVVAGQAGSTDDICNAISSDEAHIRRLLEEQDAISDRLGRLPADVDSDPNGRVLFDYLRADSYCKQYRTRLVELREEFLRFMDAPALRLAIWGAGLGLLALGGPLWLISILGALTMSLLGW